MISQIGYLNTKALPLRTIMALNGTCPFAASNICKSCMRHTEPVMTTCCSPFSSVNCKNKVHCSKSLP